MAQDIGLDTATEGPAVTMPTSDVTTTNVSTLSAILDFGSPTPIEIGYDWIQTTLTSCIDFAYLRFFWSHDGTNTSDIDNPDVIATLQCTASADKRLVGTFSTRARYAKFDILNQSGGTLDFTSSNSDLTLYDVFGNQA